MATQSDTKNKMGTMKEGKLLLSMGVPLMISMLLDSGVDLHSYQPTADDILKISTCDVFIYVGGGSDEWVEDALKEAVNKDMITVDLCETLGDTVKQEEQIEGMENSHERFRCAGGRPSPYGRACLAVVKKCTGSL